MGLRTRWELSQDGKSYQQVPANPIPIVATPLVDLLIAAALFPSKKRARDAIEGGRVKVGTNSGSVCGGGDDDDEQNGSRKSKLTGCKHGGASARGHESCRIVVDPSVLVHPAEDVIVLDGKERSIEHFLCTYQLLHKPRGYICSNAPEGGAPAATSLIHDDMRKFEGLFTCGRLDAQSEGLLLVTNDGKLGRRLLDPGRCEKRYELLVTPKTIRGSSVDCSTLKETFERVCKEGQHIIEGPKEVLVRPRSIAILEHSPRSPCPQDMPIASTQCVWVEVSLTDGRKRVLRRLFGALGYRVLLLIRTEFAGISDDGLLQQPGGFRQLTPREIRQLHSM